MPESDLLVQARELLPAMIDAVQALVCTESPSSDVAACAAIVEEAIGEFASWLPSPARAEVHDGRPVWRWGPDQPRILLLGHLDTVWPIGTLDRLPFTNDGQRLTGPGVFDMKAGAVQGWAALTLAQLSEQDDVGMLLTTDEEIGSHCSRGVIAASIMRARAVLVLEPSVDGALKSARKGTSWYEVVVHGRAAHAGLEPERGVNALTAAAGLVARAPTWANMGIGTSVTPTLMSAGTTPNTVPARAHVTVDVRAWTAAEQERVDTYFRQWHPGLDGATVELHGGIDRPAMEESASADLLGDARAAAAAHGLPPVQARAVGGASDGNLTASAGVPTLDGIGAVGDGAHADHEWVSIPAMAERAALLAGLIRRIQTDT